MEEQLKDWFILDIIRDTLESFLSAIVQHICDVIIPFWTYMSNTLSMASTLSNAALDTDKIYFFLQSVVWQIQAPDQGPEHGG